MKLRCPACGVEGTLDQMTQAADLLALDKAAGLFGADWPLVSEYLDCFRASPEGRLSVKRRLGMLREVWAMWDIGKFCVGGVWYLIGRPEFREALSTTVNQVQPPLRNHNYLKTVLKKAARLTSQRRERELKSREQGLGAREQEPRVELPLPPWGEGPPPVAGMRGDPEWLAKVEELGREVRKPGLTPEARAAARQALEEHLKTGGADDGGE